MINELRANRRTMPRISPVLLTALFMFGFVLALVYAYRLAAGEAGEPIIELPFILLGTAVGGGVGVRVARRSWRETAIAAFLSVVALIVYARFEPSFPGPWIPSGPERTLDLTSALVYLAVGTGGIFFLPLFDPVVRRAGPAPSLGMLALVALCLAVLTVLIDYLLGGGSFFGLLTLIFGSIASALLVGAGMILTLANVTAPGAWLGGLAVLLEACIVAAWWLLGRPWFP
ncbi:MAG TPA: hypothetical protein VJ821_03835 [Anaerolineales bacterium]|nr:hypothetical protein [Anaerolineales bacterium]